MEKFDGYLICSDYDGTFATGGVPIPENLEAVRYFIENGGRFTFATGRTVAYIRDKGLLPYVNAPACLCNGSVVHDYDTGRFIWECRLSYTVERFLKAIEPKVHLISMLHVFTDADRGGIDCDDLSNVDEEVLQAKAIKLLCRFPDADSADEFKAFAMDLPFFSSSYISKSWSIGVEFNAAGGTKGHALRFIKEYLGNIHTAIGIGDNENDVPLMTCADIGVAAGNAVEEVKQAATWVVRPCVEGAVASLIEKLEQNMQ